MNVTVLVRHNDHHALEGIEANLAYEWKQPFQFYAVSSLQRLLHSIISIFLEADGALWLLRLFACVSLYHDVYHSLNNISNYHTSKTLVTLISNNGNHSNASHMYH